MASGESGTFEKMPSGYLTFEQFAQDLQAAVLSAKGPFETYDERYTFALKYLCDSLAIDELNHGDIDILADHMAHENSEVILQIWNRKESREVKRRMKLLYEEIVHFEKTRNKEYVPRTDEPPPTETPKE